MFQTSEDATAPAIEPPVPPPAPKSHWWNSQAAQRAALAVVAAVPVALVNSVAFIGQFEFLRTHVPWIVPGQVLFAVALESVAVYLAWHAHIAKLANDSSGRIMASAYLFALVIASMNYSHYAGPHWHPTFMAVGLALMSAASPWLWNVHSRRVSRDKLMARGLLEEKAVRLGATRWTWHPVRSMLVTWLATWEGEQNPKRAIAMLDQHRAARRAAAGASRNDGTPGAPGLPAAPDPEPEPIPARQPLVGITGGAATVSARAALTAEASVSGKRPDQLTIKQTVDELAAMPVEALPSIRAIARDMLGDENQRRLAERLRNDRKNAERIDADDRPAAALRPSHRQSATSLIASPAAFAPGGVVAHGNA